MRPPARDRLVLTQALQNSIEMGLAPGCLMRQEIFEDPHKPGVWSAASSRCYVHILNSMQYVDVTGRAPPQKPRTARDYTNAGLPWFEYNDSDATALPGALKLAKLDSVAAIGAKKTEKPLPENEPVKPTQVHVIHKRPGTIREGEF